MRAHLRVVLIWSVFVYVCLGDEKQKYSLGFEPYF